MTNRRQVNVTNKHSISPSRYYLVLSPLAPRVSLAGACFWALMLPGYVFRSPERSVPIP